MSPEGLHLSPAHKAAMMIFLENSKRERKRKSARSTCRQDSFMSVSEVTDYRLKWKLPFEQRRKGYEKIQFAMTDAVRSDCLCPGAPTGTARVLPESLQMTGASGVALPAAARRTQ